MLNRNIDIFDTHNFYNINQLFKQILNNFNSKHNSKKILNEWVLNYILMSFISFK